MERSKGRVENRICTGRSGIVAQSSLIDPKAFTLIELLVVISIIARHSGGSFFQGLGRPWSGLHTIDTIRRDAGRAGIPFTTRRLPNGLWLIRPAEGSLRP